jgi:hypothetical protein
VRRLTPQACIRWTKSRSRRIVYGIWRKILWTVTHRNILLLGRGITHVCVEFDVPDSYPQPKLTLETRTVLLARGEKRAVRNPTSERYPYIGILKRARDTEACKNNRRPHDCRVDTKWPPTGIYYSMGMISWARPILPIKLVAAAIDDEGSVRSDKGRKKTVQPAARSATGAAPHRASSHFSSCQSIVHRSLASFLTLALPYFSFLQRMNRQFPIVNMCRSKSQKE